MTFAFCISSCYEGCSAVTISELGLVSGVKLFPTQFRSFSEVVLTADRFTYTTNQNSIQLNKRKQRSTQNAKSYTMHPSPLTTLGQETRSAYLFLGFRAHCCCCVHYQRISFASMHGLPLLAVQHCAVAAELCRRRAVEHCFRSSNSAAARSAATVVSVINHNTLSTDPLDFR